MLFGGRLIPVFFLLALCVVALTDDAKTSRDHAQKLFDEQPRTVERVRDASKEFDAIVTAAADNYDDVVRAARVWLWLSENETAKAVRHEAALRVLELSRSAVKLDNKRVEGHFYLGVALGTLADVERGLSAFGRIKEMKVELLRAIALDETFDEAGPHRTLGQLLLEAPGEPISVGNAAAAAKHIKRAVELSPNYPENQIVLALLLRSQRDTKGATTAAQKVLDAKPWQGKEDEDAKWKAAAKKILNPK